MGLKEVVRSYLPDLVYEANDGIVTGCGRERDGCGNVDKCHTHLFFSDRPWLIAGVEMLILGTVASGVAYSAGALSAALIA